MNSIDDAVLSVPGVTTLRDAINKANADSGEDLIVFDKSLFSNAQTITLSLGELDITHSLDIIAPQDTLTGGDLVSVSGNNASRVFDIETGATVTLSGLMITGGSVTRGNGGAISNSGNLNLDNTIVSGNNVISNFVSSTVFTVVSGDGGGIYNTGTLNLSNSTVNSNTANDGTSNGSGIVSGGGIYNTGSVVISNSTVSGNRVIGGNYAYPNSTGGGIYNSGSLVIINSTLNNSASGGIYNTRNLTVSDTTIANNSVSGGGGDGGGGIFNSGNATVSNSTINNNRTLSGGHYSISTNGGGIDNRGTITVSNSTISGNTASYGGFYTGGNGGGIFNSGTSRIINSTISGNSAIFSGNPANGNGGGIYNTYTGTVTLLFSTVTQNQAANGGGVYQDDVPLSSSVRGSFNVRNTIIAANLNSKNGVNPDVSGTFTSNGYNLIGDGTGSTGFGVTGDIFGTSANPIDPLLSPLNSNGGPTQTIALLPGSPAIGAADPTVLDTDPTTDQRGLPRRAADGSADIGAFQLS